MKMQQNVAAVQKNSEYLGEVEAQGDRGHGQAVRALLLRRAELGQEVVHQEDPLDGLVCQHNLVELQGLYADDDVLLRVRPIL